MMCDEQLTQSIDHKCAKIILEKLIVLYVCRAFNPLIIFFYVYAVNMLVPGGLIVVYCNYFHLLPEV